ncbi:MAG: ATP-binding protein [Muribaculaceae bacterium]|nr:ATP-binding protein [Muribaculaceae bacterium]
MDFIPDYITKIVGNLISNAIKFTPPYGVVTISTETRNNRFILTVQDNGCGISAQDLPYIFDAFYQCNSKSRSVGSGIGLSLVKQLVEAMNGTVSVESQENSGTSFTVDLPLSQSVNQIMSLTEKPAIDDIFVADGEESLPVEWEDDSLTRILIVEDNNDVSTFIGSIISNANIYYARNGKDGLEKALQIVPDVIITDIMMPEMDGIEMCAKIRQSDILCHIPIIIISAKAEQNDKIEGLKSGADAYLYKPFNSEELNVTINSLLERRKLLQEHFARNSAKDLVPTEQFSVNDKGFLNKVIDLVHAQMASQCVSINDLADSLNMTPRQLNRKINAITGDNISKYVLEVRMLHAKHLLDSNKDYTVAEVAYKCGYEENSNFTRAFKMLYGITPTQYRKMP